MAGVRLVGRGAHALRDDALKLVAREAADAVLPQPDGTVRDLDVREDVRLWKLILLALRCLVPVGCKGSDVGTKEYLAA